jgi:hypothetical protein
VVRPSHIIPPFSQDVMFRKNEHEAATYHFQQLLEKNPTQYAAMDKLVQLLRRAGRLTEVDTPLMLIWIITWIIRIINDLANGVVLTTRH